MSGQNEAYEAAYNAIDKIQEERAAQANAEWAAQDAHYSALSKGTPAEPQYTIKHSEIEEVAKHLFMIGGRIKSHKEFATTMIEEVKKREETDAAPLMTPTEPAETIYMLSRDELSAMVRDGYTDGVTNLNVINTVAIACSLAKQYTDNRRAAGPVVMDTNEQTYTIGRFALDQIVRNSHVNGYYKHEIENSLEEAHALINPVGAEMPPPSQLDRIESKLDEIIAKMGKPHFVK